MPVTLTLSPTFGGTRHGPFPDRDVSVGSAPDSDVVVAAALGVAPTHARLTGNGARWTLSAGAPECVVFAARAGTRLAPIRGAFDLLPGDSFALGSADGVCFLVEAAAAAATEDNAGAARPSKIRGRLPTADALASEARRQVEVELMRHGPVQDAQRLAHQYKTGALFNPRNLVAAVFSVFGAIFSRLFGRSR